MRTERGAASFGRHVRSLRKARGLTQEQLAERAELSPDTIRRLEHGSFSPSLDTLRKLCGGLSLQLSTFFEGWELAEDRELRSLVDAAQLMNPAQRKAAILMLHTLAEILRCADEIDDDQASVDDELSP